MLLVVSVLTSGCGVKLAYNNADTLARWWVSDYIDMTRSQRAYFDASTADIMYWHRTTQLTLYKQGLLDIADVVASFEMDPLRLQATADEVERWGVAFNAKAVPVALEIMLSLSLEQRGAFDAALAKSNRQYEREAERDVAVRAKDEAKDYARLVRRLVGRLSPKQRELILNQHLRMVPDAKVIWEYRLDWQQKILGALNANPPDMLLLEDLMGNFDEHYTPEFRQMIDANEIIYQKLTLSLINSLTPKQQSRLVAELRGYAQLCDELIARAPKIAPAAPRPLSSG